MTRTAGIVRAELVVVEHRCAEIDATWLDRCEAPPEELSGLYLRRDVLRDELAELGEEDAA